MSLTLPVLEPLEPRLLLSAGHTTKADLGSSTMAYVLQADQLAPTKEQAVTMLANSGRDLVVIDSAYDTVEYWTAADIAAIRAAKPGRQVVAYLSIGEAETYRPYWQESWDANNDGKPDPAAPDFLFNENPDWEGNYLVKYWEQDWQNIILGSLQTILDQGFDGVYLDRVDAFEDFEHTGRQWIDNKPNPETGQTYREDMIDWVTLIADTARAASPGFLVIPQNGSQLLESSAYVNTLDAIGIEDLFTVGNKKKNKKETAYVTSFTRHATDAGKSVILIEYATKPKIRTYSIQNAAAHEFPLLLTDRDLTTLGTSYLP